MSIDIGYNYWENGKIVWCDDAWMNGRNDLGRAWGRYFNSGRDPKTNMCVEKIPVFNKEMDGVVLYGKDGDDFTSVGYFVDLKRFLGDMFMAVRDAEDEDNEIKLDLVRANELDRQRIAGLRDEQRKCTDEDAYAFRKWGEEVDELYESIADRQRAIDDPNVRVEEYDSPYWEVANMRTMLEQMQKDVEAGKIVIPFYSY